jgi:hypothetical protein
LEPLPLAGVIATQSASDVAFQSLVAFTWISWLAVAFSNVNSLEDRVRDGVPKSSLDLLQDARMPTTANADNINFVNFIFL